MESKDGEVDNNNINTVYRTVYFQNRRFCSQKNLCWSMVTSDSRWTGKEHSRVFWSTPNILYLYFGYWLHRCIHMLKKSMSCEQDLCSLPYKFYTKVKQVLGCVFFFFLKVVLLFLYWDRQWGWRRIQELS